jgi:hypothetical protein
MAAIPPTSHLPFNARLSPAAKLMLSPIAQDNNGDMSITMSAIRLGVVRAPKRELQMPATHYYHSKAIKRK